MSFPCSVAGCNITLQTKAAQISHSKACERQSALKEDERRRRKNAKVPRPPKIAVEETEKPWDDIEPLDQPSVPKPGKGKSADNSGLFSTPLRPGPSGQQPPAQSASVPIPTVHLLSSTSHSADIRIDFHAKRKKQSEYMSLDDYNLHRRRPGTSEKRYTTTSLTAHHPYYPFETRVDYKFAQLMFRSAMKEDDVKEMLALIEQCVRGDDRLTLQSYDHIHDMWKAASGLVTPFRCHPIEVPWKDQPKKYDVYVRSVWDWLLETVKNPMFASDFVWDSTRLFKREGDEWIRFVHEPWTGDDWAEIEDSLPDDGVPLCLIVYADKTQLSSFRGKNAYPVYARIANLPVHIRNGNKLGGGCVVGWLPVVDNPPTVSRDNAEWVDYKRIVWHESFRQVLASIKEYSKTGYSCKCGDGVVRKLFPCVFILSADYEEQAVMAGIRGSKTKRCTVCLVNEEDLAKYLPEWEYRDSEQTRKLMYIIDSPRFSEERKEEARTVLQQQNLRPIKNAFSEINNSDPHRALSFDRLHGYPGGLAKTHLLPLIFKQYKGDSAEATAIKNKVNDRADAFPRWRGLHHLEDIMTNHSFQDSNKWEDMARILPFIMYDGIVESSDKLMLQTLKCLRIFLNLNAYSSFEVHTTATIKALEDELKAFSKEIEKLAGLTPEKDWEFPKMHLHMHMPRDIIGKGVTRNYITKPFESMHRALKEFYLFMTNFKDVTPQILNAEHISYVIKFIDSLINAHEEARRSATECDDTGDREGPQARYTFGHVILKAPQGSRVPRAIQVFEFDPQEELDDYATLLHRFNFKQELVSFCCNNAETIGFNVNDMALVRSFRSTEIFYVS